MGIDIADLLIKNIGELATPTGIMPKSGNEQGKISILRNTCVAVTSGRISYIGGESNAPKHREEIDAEERLVTPGLVDAHTHAVFGGWRQHELSLKLSGASYLDILKSGGGILSTVEQTRKTGVEELTEKTAKLLDMMFMHGTTTCEIKSGYGLNLEDELKQLQVIKNLKSQANQDLIATFMGAHAIPKEFTDNRSGYIELLCEKIIPLIASEGLAEYCDVFCENSVFTIDESRTILSAARKCGLGLKLHADEIDYIGGAELAAEMGAVSAEHLIRASDEGIKALAKSRVTAVLLPATSWYLDKPYAHARKMIEEGAAVAVASDFNPGSSPNLNLQFPMNLACLKYKMTPAEVLTAVTLNAAHAIGRADIIGTLEIGKKADMVIWDAPDLDFLFYRYGNNQTKVIIKAGTVHNV